MSEPQKALWEEFLGLDADNDVAVRRFVREKRLVRSAFPDEEGDIPRQRMEPQSVRDAQREFRRMVQALTRYGLSPAGLRALAKERRKRKAQMERRPLKPLSDLPRKVTAEDEEWFSEYHALLRLNDHLSYIHPMVGVDKGDGYALITKDDKSTTLGDIYLSFAEDFTNKRVGVCAYCRRLFQLTSKQQASLYRKNQRVYCPGNHRILFKESQESRKEKKRKRESKRREAERKLRKIAKDGSL